MSTERSAVTKALTSIMLLALVITLVKAAEHPASTSYCVESDEQEKQIRTLMFDALDQAFREHQAHLFDVWVKDQAETPERAVSGSRVAIDAYLRSRRGIVNWKPQRCN